MPLHKTFIIPWVLYPYEVMVSTDTREKILEKLAARNWSITKEEKKLLRMGGIHLGICVMLSTGHTVLRLEHPPDSPKNIACLCHEAYHAACFLFDRIGVVYCKESDEVFAHAIDYLVEKTLIEFKR